MYVCVCDGSGGGGGVLPVPPSGKLSLCHKLIKSKQR